MHKGQNISKLRGNSIFSNSNFRQVLKTSSSLLALAYDKHTFAAQRYEWINKCLSASFRCGRGGGARVKCCSPSDARQSCHSLLLYRSERSIKSHLAEKCSVPSFRMSQSLVPANRSASPLSRTTDSLHQFLSAYLHENFTTTSYCKLVRTSSRDNFGGVKYWNIRSILIFLVTYSWFQYSTCKYSI